MAKLNKDIFGVADVADVADVESFLVEVEIAINRVMHAKGVSRSELADRMGVKPSRVSQILSDAGSNITLTTLAKVFEALDEKVSVSSPVILALNEQAEARSQHLKTLYRNREAENVWNVDQEDDFAHFESFELETKSAEGLKFTDTFTTNQPSRRVAA